ncbi:DUF2103 domain-containing protein [Rivularia sp. UHCC 0363]|uniref:DUF2103 domain-containing protein n=1 Tax=Rivularia sp. UHCC 0363 TaxID=3110244 RepID=UPI002B1F3129|nr:DUF2103 domain-containing protein [Rivularia sp. UHCC 0363]MEA5599172.1 DUF2103 domain-containing protein [Rivularia sp. UHCC 0363]
MAKPTSKSTKAISNREKNGRLVWNHSTHINGLIPILERLCNQDSIQTVTPGELSRVRGHSPHMQLRVSVPIRGGFKVIARQGKTVQEVFILTTLGQDELVVAIASAMKK